MSRYIYNRGAEPILEWHKGVPPRALQGHGPLLGDVTLVPGGPEPIDLEAALAGFVETAKATAKAHPILTALGALVGWHVGGKLVRHRSPR